MVHCTIMLIKFYERAVCVEQCSHILKLLICMMYASITAGYECLKWNNNHHFLLTSLTVCDILSQITPFVLIGCRRPAACNIKFIDVCCGSQFVDVGCCVRNALSSIFYAKEGKSLSVVCRLWNLLAEKNISLKVCQWERDIIITGEN